MFSWCKLATMRLTRALLSQYMHILITLVEAVSWLKTALSSVLLGFLVDLLEYINPHSTGNLGTVMLPHSREGHNGMRIPSKSQTAR